MRVMAPIYGSVLTYGYVFSATAPGQMSVAELRVSHGDFNARKEEFSLILF